MAIVIGVLVCLGLGTILGVIGLALGIRRNPHEDIFGITIWAVSILIGLNTYRHMMRTGRFNPLPLLLAIVIEFGLFGFAGWLESLYWRVRPPHY